uniref:Opioid growth factor receptor n=1 Tax=Jaculus jaculus TaxID=51337 RepID=A0A8C5P397_JACJA
MDELDCDSTWEEDDGAEDGQADDAGDEDGDAGRPRPGSLQSRMTGYRNWRAMQDMRRYRHHYPDLVEQDCNGDMPNLSFYRNEIRFQPNGYFIEDILQDWKDNYDLLEDNHSYIQWLFPLREPGVNWHAKPLTLKEIEAFKRCEVIRERLIRAYELMLGFYGIHLENRDTGAVCRAQNYQQRFKNLNCRSHNNLRITRILKSLGELGLEHYQAPLAHFFLQETLVREELPGVRQSALDYFLFAVLCPRQRRELVHFAWEHFQPRCKFVWGPHNKLRKFRPQATPWPLVGPGQAEGARDPFQEADTQSRTCGSGKDPSGESESTEGPQLLSTSPQDVGTLDGDPGDETKPMSPKESKKRKLEANRLEQAPRKPDPQGVSEVEKIALNLEGCALSPGNQDPGEMEQPSPVPLGVGVADEMRKRRKVEEEAGGDGVAANPSIQIPASSPSECPEAQQGGDGPKEDPESQVGPEQGAPGSPRENPGPVPGSTGTSVDESGETAGLGSSPGPGTP